MLLSFAALFLLACGSEKGKHRVPDGFKTEKLLFSDDFSDGIEDWVPEVQDKPGSYVTIEDGKLIADVQGGATIWFKHKLKGNILIEYERKVVIADGPNDRLSDMNMFWMANDPENSNLFTRDGVFARYHPLLLYYAGIGGNGNTTTRFRKYDGTGQRILHAGYSDEEHLLKPNKTYLVQIVVHTNSTSLYLDGENYFSFTDKNPLKSGYFGFRLVKSHQAMDNFKVYRLKE